jgi:hypothetical protein
LEERKMGDLRVISRAKHDEIFVTTTENVLAAGETTLIPAHLVNGRKGDFTVNNAGANTITVFPRVSNDGTTWFEMDNGTGTALATTVKHHFPFTGNYKYIMLVATASTQSDGVVSTMYVASI